ncbi:MAG: hypothetical protein JNL84_01085 [Candidatus Accumulibacter sp.]|nr:hypothetical protein [Accumulibacter sp.]
MASKDIGDMDKMSVSVDRIRFGKGAPTIQAGGDLGKLQCTNAMFGALF